MYDVKCKVGKNRDTVSIEPGSRPFCGSRSVSTDTLLGVAGRKDTFSYTSDTLRVSSDTETVSVSVSPSQNFCVGNNLERHIWKSITLSKYQKSLDSCGILANHILPQ